MYQYTAKHVPGKSLLVADTLSRAPVSQPTKDESSSELQQEVEAFIESVTSTLPATEQCLKEYQQAQAQDNDLNVALLNYQATSLPWCNRSPSELLMGRRIRTTLPQTNSQLIPQWPYLEEFKKCNKKFKQRQKKDFDHHNRVHKLPDIPDNADVWIQSANRPTQGQVISKGCTPRSYVVSTPTGTVQQNRAHLRVVPNSTE